MNEDQLHAFFLRGEAITVEANTRYLLNDPNCFFWVEEESGDLFLFSPEDRNFIPIFMVEASFQGIFFPSPAPDGGIRESLFFISSHRTKLRKLPFAMLLQESEAHPELLSAMPLFLIDGF